MNNAHTAACFMEISLAEIAWGLALDHVRAARIEGWKPEPRDSLMFEQCALRAELEFWGVEPSKDAIDSLRAELAGAIRARLGRKGSK